MFAIQVHQHVRASTNICSVAIFFRHQPQPLAQIHTHIHTHTHPTFLSFFPSPTSSLSLSFASASIALANAGNPSDFAASAASSACKVHAFVKSCYSYIICNRVLEFNLRCTCQSQTFSGRLSEKRRKKEKGINALCHQQCAACMWSTCAAAQQNHASHGETG